MQRRSARLVRGCACAIAALAGCAGAMAQVDHQVPLNYNFHGMAHAGEAFLNAPSGNADSIMFRGISDRGLYWDGSDPDAIGSTPLVGFTGITYNLFNPLGYANTTAANAQSNGLDIVHLGSRVYYRGLETSANGGTSTGNAPLWAPIFDVSTLTGNGTTATATTAAPHGLSVGQTIAIVGASPAEFSGEFVVASVPNATTFTYACTASGTATGTIFTNSTSTSTVSSLAGNGSTVTATTSWPHGFAVGNTVNISGSSDPSYNGQNTLATIPTTSSFTYSSAAANPTTGTEIICATLIQDTVDQTTTLSQPIPVDAGTEIGILYNASDSGSQEAQFDVVLTFGTGPGAINVTARMGAPDWVGVQIDPPIISRFVTSQRRVTHNSGANHVNFRAVNNNDSANLPAFSATDASPNINVIEGVVGVQRILDAGFNVAGLSLTKITFKNAFFPPTALTAVTFSGGVGTATIAATNSPFVVGQPITLSGLSPAVYNVTSKIASITGGTSFTFAAPGVPDGTATAQMYANGVAITTQTSTTTTGTVTTASAHGLSVGDRVTISGASVAGNNGTFMVATVPSATQFTYATISAGGTSTAQRQVTRIGTNRGYAIYATTVRTGSPTVACCDNAAGTCTTNLNTCPAGTTQAAGSTCAPASCPARAACCDVTSAACTLIYGGACAANAVQTSGPASCSPAPCGLVNITPINASGWNMDIVVEASAATPTSAAQPFDVPNNWAWFEFGLPGSTKGLPAGGAFTSVSSGAITGQFQPYDGPNALQLDSATVSGTLTLSGGAQIPYRSLVVFASSTNGGGVGTMVINFTDGSASTPVNFNAQDWFGTTTNNGLNDLGRFSLATATFDQRSPDPRIYQTVVDLAGLGYSTRSISSITFTRPTASGATTTTAIMALSGQAASTAAGACCAINGTCTVVAPASCLSPSLFQGPSSACAGAGCTVAARACCNTTTGSCTYTTNTTCPSGSSNQGNGSVCSPSPCPQTGACCANTGACALSNFAACASPSLFQGLGSTCNGTGGGCPNPVGACCHPLFASCVFITGSTCPTGYIFSGAGTACSPNACVGQPSVCENLDGTAAGSLPSGWTSVVATGTGAAWSVVNTNAHSAPNAVFTNDIATVSDQQLTLPTVTAGGTLTLDLWAVWTTESTFDGWIVESSTDGVNFTNIGTAAWTQGAYNQAAISTCCTSPIAGQPAFSGTSTTWTEHTATINANPGDQVTIRFRMASDSSVASTGVWLDDICIANIQQQGGVCCRGGTCSTTVASAGDCSGSLVSGQTAGARFIASGTTCNSGAISSAPCCFADYNKANGITVQDIFDFLSDWFAGSRYASVGGNGSPATLAVQNIFDFLSNWFAGGCN